MRKERGWESTPKQKNVLKHKKCTQITISSPAILVWIDVQSQTKECEGHTKSVTLVRVKKKKKKTTKIDGDTFNEIYPHKMQATLFDLILLIRLKE